MSYKQRYEIIVSKINQAQKDGNKRQLKLWRTKLENWQRDYGAYAPVRY